MTFENYCLSKNINTNKYSESFLEYCKLVYNKLHISLAPFLTSEASEHVIKLRINDQIRKTYDIQYHNVGEDPWNRYYKHDIHACWLQLETCIIQQCTNFAWKHIKKIEEIKREIKSPRKQNQLIKKLRDPLSQMFTSNQYLAVKLGWLSELEQDPEVIEKACRKVTDNLAILKNERKTISVKQKYVYGKQGSYHVITLNWMKIIELYTNYDPKMEGSIRLRKSIKYRIISFIRTAANNFSTKLQTLMRLQKVSYLGDLLITFDLDDFQNDKYVLYKLLSRKDMGIPKEILNTKNVIPVYTDNKYTLTLKTKTDYAYNVLEHNASYLIRYFENIGVKLSIVAS